MAGLEIRKARDGEAAAISAVILTALRVTNARDYQPDIIERVALSFSPSAVQKLMDDRTVIVAAMADRIVGTASLDGRALRTMFVAPDAQKHGVGRRLLVTIEALAVQKGVEVLSLASTITAEPFYAKLGYEAVRDAFHGEERTIIMKRTIGPR